MARRDIALGLGLAAAAALLAGFATGRVPEDAPVRTAAENVRTLAETRPAGAQPGGASEVVSQTVDAVGTEGDAVIVETEQLDPQSPADEPTTSTTRVGVSRERGTISGQFEGPVAVGTTSGGIEPEPEDEEKTVSKSLESAASAGGGARLV